MLRPLTSVRIAYAAAAAVAGTSLPPTATHHVTMQNYWRTASPGEAPSSVTACRKSTAWVVHLSQNVTPVDNMTGREVIMECR